MSVKEVTEKYQCSDGRKFASKSRADQHEKLIKAKEEFDAAQRRLNIALVQSSKTADGQLFELGIFKTCYFVHHSAYGIPMISELPYIGWNFDVDTENDKVTIHVEENGRRQSFRIGEVYSDKREDERALLVEQKETLKSFSDEVDKLETRLKG